MYGHSRKGLLGFQLAYFSSQKIACFLWRIFLIKPQLNEFCLGLKIGYTEEQLDQNNQRPRKTAFWGPVAELVFNFGN
jgi:hypothetical protein